MFSQIIGAIDDGSRALVQQIQPREERDLIEDPLFNSLESPRDTLMTFMNAMALVERGYNHVGFERALRCLPDGATADDALKLYHVLLRLGPIAPTDAPGPSRERSSRDNRFQFFPRGDAHSWIWERTNPPADSVVALVRSGEGDWRFSGLTMQGLSDLQDALEPLPPRYGASASEGYFVQVFDPLLSKNSFLDWLAVVGLLVIGSIAGWGFAYGMSWVSEKAPRKFISATIRGVGRAGAVTIFTVVFTYAMGLLELGPVLETLRYEIPRFLMVLAVTFLLLSLIDMTASLFHLRAKKNPYDRMLITLIQRVTRVTLILLVVIFILQVIFSVNIGAVFLGFGVVALVLSLAAQDTVKNMFGAISVFMNRPFVVGDWIIFKGDMGEHVGVVEDIELQATKVTVLSGTLVTLPNMMFIDTEIQNLSGRGYIRRSVDISVPYRSDANELDRAIEALHDVLNDEDVVKDAMREGRDSEPHVTFFGFGDSWLTIRAFHFYFFGKPGERQRDTERGWFTYLSHCSDVNRRIVEVFGERNIEFAFPTQTIELRQLDNHPLASEKSQPSH